MCLAFSPTYGESVKTKWYTKGNPTCYKTFHLSKGRVLTSQGLTEDPHVNEVMNQALTTALTSRNMEFGGDKAQLDVRFMGGTGADVQVEDVTVGDYAVWAINGPLATTGRAYKKSVLGIAVVDSTAKQTVWAAKVTDNFGDPNKLDERIKNAVAKAFDKFPAELSCK